MKKFLPALLLPFFLLFPHKSEALSLSAAFGGYVTLSVPCTCSLGMWIYYTPLFLNAPIPLTGALYYPPGAILYSYFQLGVPTTWELGAYNPVPTAACLVLAPDPADPCIPLPAAGTIEYMGTSLPGALP